MRLQRILASAAGKSAKVKTVLHTNTCTNICTRKVKQKFPKATARREMHKEGA